MKKYFFACFFFLQMTALGQQHYKVIAYYTGSADSLYKYPVKQLTHIIYSFLKLQNDTLDFYNEQQRTNLQHLVLLKKDNPNLKIMVSIGGWGGCAGCSDIFATTEHRKMIAKTTLELFKQYNIDGIDLDWEYPAIEGYPGHKYDSTDKNNFTELVRTLRKEMGSKYIISFAAGGFINYLEKSIDWETVIPLVDFVNLMTYDLVGGYSNTTGHHTPLADYMPGQESVEKCVNWLLNKKVKASKLIVGAAFYARVWENVDSTDLGLYQSGKFLRGVSFKDFASYFCDSMGYRYYWDNKAKAPFQYSATKKLFATFDDERSISEKGAFVRKKNLGGMMFWQLADDSRAEGLVSAIRKVLP